MEHALPWMNPVFPRPHSGVQEAPAPDAARGVPGTFLREANVPNSLWARMCRTSPGLRLPLGQRCPRVEPG